jgi:hypothetical protein
MLEALPGFEDALDVTNEIADKCDVIIRCKAHGDIDGVDKKYVLPATENYIPFFQAPDGKDAANAIAVRTKDEGSTKWNTQFSVDYKGKLTAKDAYIEGVTLALADRYSCPASDFKVSVDGFDGINLTSEIMHVTLSGKAKYVDYRELSQYIESELKVVKCDVQMEIS